jgi:hypothetical protein
MFSMFPMRFKKNARSGPGGDLWVIELLVTKILFLVQTEDIFLNLKT